ncbi:hypothetical protein HYALB_00006503 [Hymenoscyphus albidus]|uniref:Uncharacterized protein n=1 Tax=Hymenoscyphus albidus TaxID=595503 RepID=A0A9N9Q6S9_9HELO|nr:hypothetical protein HYALB_00006503 [Hymenoscyphus albidus]
MAMTNIQEKDFLTWEWESKKSHGGPPGSISRTAGDFMFFGRFEGEWAYYFNKRYRKLIEAPYIGNWHGVYVRDLIHLVGKIFAMINLKVSREINLKVSREDCLKFVVPKVLLERLLENMTPAEPDRYARHCQPKLDNDYFLSDYSTSVETFVYIGGRELKYSMDSTNSWPPLDASKDTMEAFMDAAFDKNRVMSVFDSSSGIVDFEILFDQPTLHPKFHVWIRFLYRRILMRQWEIHVREMNGTTEERGGIMNWVKTTLTEWNNSSSWVPLSPEECPVRYDISCHSPRFGDYNGIEYKPVIVPNDPLTEQKYQPERDTQDPRSPKAGTNEAPQLPKESENEVSRRAASTAIKTQAMVEANALKREDAELKEEEGKEVKKEANIKYNWRANTEVKEDIDLAGGVIKKEARQEIDLTCESIKKEVKDEIDLTGTGIEKETKTWVGKRRFDDFEELKRAINDPKVSKKPRYRVVYEIVDPDEE